MRYIHIAAGLLSLVAGAVALYAAKGSPLHRKSGMIFAIAILVMTSSAVTIAGFLRPDPVNVMAGVLTFYMVSTGALTVLRPVAQVRGLLTGFMLVGLVGGTYALAMGFEALNSASGAVSGIPPQPLFLFGVVGVSAGLLDARMLWVGKIQGLHRIVRHLWRMGFAMFVATGSFFLGQAQVFPVVVRKSGLLAIPVLLVIGVVLYWLGRIVVKRQRALAYPARS